MKELTGSEYSTCRTEVESPSRSSTGTRYGTPTTRRTVTRCSAMPRTL